MRFTGCNTPCLDDRKNQMGTLNITEQHPRSFGRSFNLTVADGQLMVLVGTGIGVVMVGLVPT